MWSSHVGLVLFVAIMEAICYNPSLVLATKVKGLQGCGPRGNPGIIPHAPRSVRRCEGVNPHTPKATPTCEMEFRWTSKSSEGNCRGQNSMAWGVPYIIGKLLECLCLKWAYIAHLHIWNTSYGQKEGQEPNWQFDSRPLKVRNRPDSLMCRQCATYRWKALDEGYNFTLDLISIEGLFAKLWRPKVAGVPTLAISDSHLGVLGQKVIWTWASPKSGPWWVLCVWVAHGSS